MNDECGRHDSTPGFDWRIYSDATCAGLSVLVPIPLVDLAFESFFRRRMPASICRVRGVPITDGSLEVLRRRHGSLLTVHGCVMLPVVGFFYLLKRLSRKILYFLTIREATEQLSVYWHRAFLLDHMAGSGQLQGSPEAVETARDALEWTLETATTSPLTQLARTTVRGAHRVMRLLIRARRKGDDTKVRAQEKVLESHWADVSAHLEHVAAMYDATFLELTRTEGRKRRAEARAYTHESRKKL